MIKDMPLSNNVSLALHMMHLFIVGAQQRLLIRKLFQDRKKCNNTGERKMIQVIAKYNMYSSDDGYMSY